MKYVITDVTPDKRSKDWDRVAGVFVMGQFWQFKDWPHEGIKGESLVEALSRIRGFWLRYSTDPPNLTVKTWNVKALSISHAARHGDKCGRGGTLRAWLLPPIRSRRILPLTRTNRQNSDWLPSSPVVSQGAAGAVLDRARQLSVADKIAAQLLARGSHHAAGERGG